MWKAVLLWREGDASGWEPAVLQFLQRQLPQGRRGGPRDDPGWNQVWQWDGEWRRTFSSPSFSLAYIILSCTRKNFKQGGLSGPQTSADLFPNFYPNPAARQTGIGSSPISLALAAALFPLLTQRCVAAEAQLCVRGWEIIKVLLHLIIVFNFSHNGCPSSLGVVSSHFPEYSYLKGRDEGLSGKQGWLHISVTPLSTKYPKGKLTPHLPLLKGV